MKRIIIINILLLVSAIVYSQCIISGTFPGLNNQQIKLVGFKGFDTYVIDSIQANKEGKFILNYSDDYYGMGYLVSAYEKPFIVVLSGEDIVLKGELFSKPGTIEIMEGRENILFGEYASEHPRREQVLSVWVYLEKIYQADSLFTVHKTPLSAIKQEKQRIKKEDSTFLAGLSPRSYVSWFMPVRKIVGSVSSVAQYRTEELPSTIDAFRNINYSDPRLYKSGLLKDVIDSHFWLIENSGRSLDSVYKEMNISIDHIITDLLHDEQRLNEITEYLFKLLEKRSLFKASEYLALRLLNEQGCTINNDFAAQLESYRAMKKGNTAPDMDFKTDMFAPGYDDSNKPNKLSDLESEYTAVFFGASWCPQCSGEISEIVGLYDMWKTHGVEVVFISLDEDKQVFENYAGNLPFISICDYQKWESPTVLDYHVFATPTIYLLDDKREILLRPNSVSHLNSWIDWFLVKENR